MALLFHACLKVVESSIDSAEGKTKAFNWMMCLEKEAV